MLRASENCARRPPAALEVEPPASWSRSSRTTSAPASARWNAALAPTTPPPTITTSAPAGSGTRGIEPKAKPQIADCLHLSYLRRMRSETIAIDADAVCRRVRVITHAKSLGGVESLIERRAPGLVRLGVGCEHVEDLWADLEQAL